jgi:MFS family permease
LNADAAPRRLGFLLLYSAQFIVGLGNTMLLAVLPPLARRLGLPDASVGWIFSLSALLWVVSSSFWGRMSDETGRKPIVALGLAAYAASMGAFGLVALAGDAGRLDPVLIFIGLLLSRAVFGGVGSATSPAAQAYVADHTPPAQRTEEIAALASSFALGAAVGPALAGLVAARAGPIPPILAVAVAAAAAAAVMVRFLPEPDRAERSPRLTRIGWALALDPRVSGHLLFGVGLSTATSVLQQTFGFYTMDRLGLTETQAISAAAVGLMVGGMALLMTQIGLIRVFRLRPRMMMIVGAALIAAGVLAQIVADSLIALAVSQMIQGIGFGFARPGFFGGASLAVKPDEQGGLAGLVVAANGAGFIVSPLVGVTLYAVVGPFAPLWLAAALAAAMTIFAWRSRRLAVNADASSAQDAPAAEP